MLIKEQELAPLRPETSAPFLTGPGGTKRAAPITWLSMRQLNRDWFTLSDEEFPELSSASRSLSEYQGGTALVFAYDFNVPPLTDLDWRCFSHSSGGMSCSNRQYVGFKIAPELEIIRELGDLARSYFYYRTGNFDRSDVKMSDLIEYNESLKKLGLSCETSYSKLEEAIYPIDATRSNFQQIIGTGQMLPDIYGGLTESGHGGGTIFLLANNSD